MTRFLRHYVASLLDAGLGITAALIYIEVSTGGVL